LLHNWSELYIVIHAALKQFPKRDFHGIGKRIEETALNMLEYLILASKKDDEQRINLLEKLDRELVKEKILVRLSNRIKAMPDSSYINIEKRIVEMGKMIGGWIKDEKRKITENKAKIEQMYIMPHH
jgi:hypothetical protein